MVPPAVVYKYVDQYGARKILENCTFRLARPSEMNDPFDIYIADLELDLAVVQQRAIAASLELLRTAPDRYARVTGASPAEMRIVTQLVSEHADNWNEFRAKILSVRHEDEDEGLEKARRRLEPQLAAVKSSFQNAAILCMSRTASNLLMWAHYAQQHRGVVLGFRPDREKDSFLTILEPVRYTDERPQFYAPLDDVIASGKAVPAGAAEPFSKGLMLSKSKHWSYEEELRLVIPGRVPVGEPAIFLKFWPQELCEVYLGCRANGEFTADIKAAARALNPGVCLFTARLEAGSYDLGFDVTE